MAQGGVRIDPSTNSALLKKAFETEVKMQSSPADILEALTGVAYAREAPPDDIVMKVNLSGGNYQETFPLLLDLDNSPTEGRDLLAGNGEDQRLKHLTVFSNDFSHAVNSRTFGIDFHTTENAYGLYSKAKPQLAKYRKEIRGRYKREALLERYSSNLTKAPTSKTQEWNSHIYVQNSGEVTYDSTLSTYTEAIGDAITTQGTTSAGHWDFNLLDVIAHYAPNEWNLEPVNDDGMYAVMVPSHQTFFLNQHQNNASLATLRRDVYLKDQNELAMKGYLGNYRNLILFEDLRAPRLDRTGSDGSWALTGYYYEPGSDNRSSASTRPIDVGFVLGKNALAEAVHEEMHIEEHDDEFGKFVEIGFFEGAGFQTVEYDEDSETDTSRRNQNSAAILCYSGTIV